MNKSISKFVVGALAAILPATALASEPEASLAAKASPAAAVAAPAESGPAWGIVTPEQADSLAQHHHEMARHYRALGGVGYKSGLVQRAEADAARDEALALRLRATAQTTRPESPEAERFARLAVQYRKLGAVAYKTGLVHWAEAQQRKYEPTDPSASPTTQDVDRSCHFTKPVICAQLGVR